MNESKLEKLTGPSVFTTTDAAKLGVTRADLTRGVRQKHLVRLQRGLYAINGRQMSYLWPFAEVSVRAKGCVICLQSALRYHKIIDEPSRDVWICINKGDRAPSFDYLNVHAVGTRLNDDYEVISTEIDGVPVLVTSLERTIVDCFKFRNKIGIDVAIEALRAASRAKILDQERLWACAKRLRMANVVMPYFTSLQMTTNKTYIPN
ncbi:transcriptional regulator [Vibrio parahaemolyticus]|nr:transcriptional regulator [Vibrio parahaemolyticus]